MSETCQEKILGDKYFFIMNNFICNMCFDMFVTPNKLAYFYHYFMDMF